MAIYNAIIKAGFYIHKAYPVKAEMSVSVPKNGSKSPINIDALMVCKKRETLETINGNVDKNRILENYQSYIMRLNKVGRNLSDADKKVIYLSQLLCELSKKDTQSEKASQFINEEQLQQIISETSRRSLLEYSNSKSELLTLFD